MAEGEKEKNMELKIEKRNFTLNVDETTKERLIEECERIFDEVEKECPVIRSILKTLNPNYITAKPLSATYEETETRIESRVKFVLVEIVKDEGEMLKIYTDCNFSIYASGRASTVFIDIE